MDLDTYNIIMHYCITELFFVLTFIVIYNITISNKVHSDFICLVHAIE